MRVDVCVMCVWLCVCVCVCMYRWVCLCLLCKTGCVPLSHPFLQTLTACFASPRRPVFDCVGGGAGSPAPSIVFGDKNIPDNRYNPHRELTPL